MTVSDTDLKLGPQSPCPSPVGQLPVTIGAQIDKAKGSHLLTFYAGLVEALFGLRGERREFAEGNC